MLPYLFHIGRFGLPTYGVLAAVGLIVGLTINVRLAKADGIDPTKAWDLGVISIFAAILGAKALLIVNNWGYYSSHLRELFNASMLQAGGVYYGGVLGGIAAALYYMRAKQMPFLRTFDAFAPGIALGHGIGRIGCFAAGCCYGKPTDLPWGVTFSDPLAHLNSGTPLHVPLHPTQLYEYLTEMLIFAVLVVAWRKRKFEGQVAGTYLFLFGVARFFIEFYRDDPDRGSVFGGAMSGTQLISILLVIAGGVIWMRHKTPIHEPNPATRGA